jgi:hypothetical protein
MEFQMSDIKKYYLSLKDEDGEIYKYHYNDLKWDADGSLSIFKYIGVANGEKQMALIAKFQNCRAILEIGEVEDEG